MDSKGDSYDYEIAWSIDEILNFAKMGTDEYENYLSEMGANMKMSEKVRRDMLDYMEKHQSEELKAIKRDFDNKFGEQFEVLQWNEDVECWESEDERINY